MNKMLEKNVIGWKEGDYSVLTLQSFLISQFVPALKLCKEVIGDINLYNESSIRSYAEYTQDSLHYILAKISPAFYPVCPELRPMQFSVKELLQDFATGLSCFVREVDILLSMKDNTRLREYSSAVKEFIEVIPLVKLSM